MTKKIIRAVAEEDVKHALTGTLASMKAEVERLIEVHGEDAEVDIDAEAEDYSYSSRRYAYVRIYVRRPESDEEYSTRVNREQEYTAQKLARDKAEFERLSKQFSK